MGIDFRGKVMLIMSVVMPMLAMAAPTWRMAVEKEGTTNWVGAADEPLAANSLRLYRFR